MHTQLESELQTAMKSFKDLMPVHTTALRTYKRNRTVLDSEYWSCSDLTTAATNVQSLTLADTDAARTQLIAVRGLAAAMLHAIGALSLTDQQCPRVRAMKAFADAVSIAGEGWSEKLDKIESETVDLAKAIKSVKAAMADPESFWEKRQLGPYDAHTKVTVEVKSTGSDGKTANTITVPVLTFGSPIFTLSGGMVFSPMETRQYVRVQGTRETAMGGVEIVNRVGRSEASNQRILPMALLHVKVGPTYYVSIGATAKPDKQGTQPEFLFGGSKSFASGWLFLTAGAYVGRQSSLDGGLAEGTIVPATLAEIPVRKSTTVRFGFSISFKLK